MTRTSIDLIKLHTGDRVHRIDDPRHVGRVEAVHPTMSVTVKWANGWKELIEDYREIVRVK